MTISLYDTCVPNYLQTLASVSGFMKKGRDFCTNAGMTPDDIVETRIAPDMHPFRFQIVSVAHHSLGAVDAVLNGVFKPPKAANESYDELLSLIDAASAKLKAVPAEAVNAKANEKVEFQLGSRAIPFKASNFILSFSLPNFYFHATTAYDLLRAKGAPLGKVDYLGALRIGA